ncbi:MAG: hypothetical protein M1830_005479 [Pleopsidium flavum]|nr:MAG: hypothetical protein M1830_005479 [Pleopsidium flavum]
MERTRTVSPFQAVRDEIRLRRRKDATQHSELFYLLATLQSPMTLATIDMDQQAITRPSSFSTLPPELILLIFESVSSLNEVANLIRTARVVRHVWQLKATPISYTFFPRAIDCFSEAQQLVDAQEQVEAEQQQQQESQHHDHQKDHQTALSRTERILSNARHVSLSCDFYETEMIPQIVLNKHINKDHTYHYLTSTERTRFTQTYYRMWTFTTMGDTRHSTELRSSFLARLNNRELYRIREVGLWLTMFADREGLARLGLIESGGDMQGNGWYLAWVELAREWDKRMEELPGDDGRMNIPGYAPLDMFAMFDMWQEWLEPSFFTGTSMWTER